MNKTLINSVLTIDQLNAYYFEKLGFTVTEEGLRFKYSSREVLKKIARLMNPPFDKEIHKKFFASSLNEINPGKIKPALIEVNTSQERRIFRHALSFWSVPVTPGYGRRLRFIVWDDYNKKVIGIFGLCDPVIGLEVRDRFIGWTREVKKERLYNLMTAYVLGAVPPYNQLLGGKLVALISSSNEVRNIVYNKYNQGRKKEKKPYLIAIDTLGAFGKSVIYNRLKGWKFVGYTKGMTHYHLTCNGFFEYAKNLLIKTGYGEEVKKYEFGDGPNWKIRVIKKALKVLGIRPEKVMYFGLRRGYYFCPLAENWKDFFTMKTDNPVFKDYPFDDVIKYWKERWLIKRLN